MLALDQVRATIIYFAGFVILNVFFFAPLSLAMIFNVFRGGQSGIPRMEEEIRLESSAAAFAYVLCGVRFLAVGVEKNCSDSCSLVGTGQVSCEAILAR